MNEPPSQPNHSPTYPDRQIQKFFRKYFNGKFTQFIFSSIRLLPAAPTILYDIAI